MYIYIKTTNSCFYFILYLRCTEDAVGISDNIVHSGAVGRQVKRELEKM